MSRIFPAKGAVIIGAGMSGLAAAQALADHFERVIVLDRDDLPSRAIPRPGVPQGRHAHTLLSGGLSALCDLFPDFASSIAQAGAHAGDCGLHVRSEFPGPQTLPRRELGVPFFLMTRPLLELTVRHCVQERKNVVFRSGCRVVGIAATPDGDAVASVSFLTREGELEVAHTDVVVDASGRGIPTLNFLKSIERPAPEETIIGVDFGYSSAVYEIPAKAQPDFKALSTMPNAPEHSRIGVMQLREDGYWSVVLGGRGSDFPPAGKKEFLAFASGLETPTFYHAIKGATLRGEIVQYGFPESRRRHFDRMRDFPRGLIPIGDSVCRFNPVYAQGMSVAIQEAVVLRNLVAGQATQDESSAGLGQQFLCAIEPVIESAWSLSALPDLGYPDARGERPAGLERALEHRAVLNRAACHDPDLHKLLIEVTHLIKPVSALYSPDVVRRVTEHRHPNLEASLAA
ncbi:2-polyprenyl-6-methoxyphenol hydroxylase-like FAD-dependent oxidoreductase [Paraburkholderia sp. GAS33]|jgi:2-polyprenyl-6-methoxyphenol hydroxylase-like FAD-dependent oxidoreductase|uniref:FAD-dependent oxidoreductase n=1 Tax=Paraburkholderia sp. GAS33 TaxID=3035130 RepID=UPI003D2554B2